MLSYFYLEVSMEKQLCTYPLLDILMEFTDENHSIRSKQILRILEDQYELSIERHKLYSSIRQLNERGHDIVFDKHTKGYKLRSRIFAKSEVLTLCNAVHASNFIPQKDSERLINKLVGTLSKWEQEEYNDEVYKPNPKKTSNESLMDNIEKASYAANNNLKLSFIYMQYGPTPNDGIQLQEKHSTRVVIEPRYICFVDGRPYLIIQGGRIDGFMHYRLDRMTDAVILEEQCTTPFNRIDAYEYASNKLFMYSGKEVHVTIKFQKRILDAMVDIFGTEPLLFETDENHYQISVTVNDNGIIFLAQQYIDAIEIISPEEIRNRIRKTIDATNY